MRENPYIYFNTSVPGVGLVEGGFGLDSNYDKPPLSQPCFKLKRGLVYSPYMRIADVTGRRSNEMRWASEAKFKPGDRICFKLEVDVQAGNINLFAKKSLDEAPPSWADDKPVLNLTKFDPKALKKAAAGTFMRRVVSVATEPNSYVGAPAHKRRYVSRLQPSGEKVWVDRYPRIRDEKLHPEVYFNTGFAVTFTDTQAKLANGEWIPLKSTHNGQSLIRFGTRGKACWTVRSPVSRLDVIRSENENIETFILKGAPNFPAARVPGKNYLSNAKGVTLDFPRAPNCRTCSLADPREYQMTVVESASGIWDDISAGLEPKRPIHAPLPRD
jgi:hypothetical protein